MNKRVALGVGGGLLLALGLLIGVIVGPSLQALAAGSHAQAAKTTPTATGYCQLYEQTALNNLPGVTKSQLESANQKALQAVINQMYADGKITQAQQAQAQQELIQYAQNPCAALNAIAQAKGAANASSGASSEQAQAIQNARGAILTAVAGALHTPSATLQSELTAGKTVAQITSEKGASKSAVDAAYLNAAQAQLTKAVSDGSLTQAQSDMAYTLLQQSVTSGKYPLLDPNSGSFSGSFSGMLGGQ
jgi:hypothetical protein